MLGAGIEDGDVQTPQRRGIIEQRVDLIVEAQIRRSQMNLVSQLPPLSMIAVASATICRTRSRSADGGGMSARSGPTRQSR